MLQRDVASLDDVAPGTAVDLGDADSRRANHVAHPAAVAIVDRVIGCWLARMAEPARLRPFVLGAGEQVGDGRNRAGGHTNVALNALIDRQFHGLVLVFFDG